jgi:hypothetical protein
MANLYTEEQVLSIKPGRRKFAIMSVVGELRDFFSCDAVVT